MAETLSAQNSPLVEDISAQAPINNAMRHTLTEHGVGEDSLDRHVDRNSQLITGDLDRLQIAMQMSQPEAVEPVTGLQDERPVARKLADFAISDVVDFKPPQLSRKQTYDIATEYNEVRRDPVRKIAYDRQLATTYLRRLGPSNSLRQDDGYDAAFELAHVRHLLETDFMVLPEGEQKPEHRMTEALLAEEMALLWVPSAPSKARQHEEDGNSDMIANPADPNLFDEQQVKELSEKERWRLVGAKLCDEAAEMFESIYLSKTASSDVRIEAVGRMVDMSIRSLQLRRGSADKAGRQAIENKIDSIATQHLALITGWWNMAPVRRSIRTGKLFESVCLAKERSEMIGRGDLQNTIRLAMPREDNIHEEVGPIISRSNTKLNMSADIIVEDINGNKIISYQSKAMSQAEYEKQMSQREAEVGALVYPEEDIEMRFLDSAGYEKLLQTA